MSSTNYLASWNAVLAPEIDPEFFNKNENENEYGLDQYNEIIPYFYNLFDNLSNEDDFFSGIQREYNNQQKDNVVEDLNENNSKDDIITDELKLDKAKQITSKNKVFTNNKEFVQTMNPLYKRALAKYGYNPNLSLMLVAQDAFESKWGLRPAGNFNYGGITTTGNDYHNRTGSHKWKDFKSIEDYVDWKVRYLNRKFNFYTFASMSNIQNSMQLLANKGYCPGSPRYGERVSSVYNYMLKKNYVY